MRHFLLLTISFYFISILQAQSKRSEVKDAHDKYTNEEVQYLSTSQLPEGTKFINGEVHLNRGYSASYSDNNNVVIIKSIKKESVVGAFSCGCDEGNGSCGVLISGNSIKCNSQPGCVNCTLSGVINPKTTAITKSGMDWKKLIIPPANMQRKKSEDPDQGGEIIKRKDIKVKQ